MTTTTVPHPPHRIPILGDLLTADPARPLQKLAELAGQLGPIYDTKIFNQHLTVVSGPDLYAELGDEKRFGKHVGFGFAVLREFLAAVSRTFAYVGRGGFRIPVRWVDNVVHHKAVKQNDEDVAYVRQVVDDVIRARRADPATQPDDLLALMLTTADPETGQFLDDENIRNQVVTFLDAGHETTSGTLSFALHLLATHPEVADRARAELYSLWPVGTEPDPAFGDIHQLKYLRRVVDETLRLWPIAAGYIREPKEDTTLGGHPVRKGQALGALTLQVHRDPVWGPDPLAFDPDRFLPERSRTRPTGIYKPFGSGIRSCIGRQLALHETVLALALILHRYDLEPEPGYELEVAEEFTLKPVGLRLGLRRR